MFTKSRIAHIDLRLLLIVRFFYDYLVPMIHTRYQVIIAERIKRPKYLTPVRSISFILHTETLNEITGKSSVSVTALSNFVTHHRNDTRVCHEDRALIFHVCPEHFPHTLINDPGYV